MYDYTVVRSKRKTIALHIDENSVLTVRAPKRCSDEKIKKVVADNTAWIERNMEKQKKRFNNKLELNEDEIKKLKVYAKKIITEKVKFYAEIMNTDYGTVKITSAEKRFGSCSGTNNLCFSYMLMLYPEEAIDYVVVHELSHTFEHNHSADFYRIIATVLPDYKKREKLLKGKQIYPII